MLHLAPDIQHAVLTPPLNLLDHLNQLWDPDITVIICL